MDSMDAVLKPRRYDPAGGVPEAVRRLRLSMALTQQQFAHVLSVTNISVSRWETGKPVARRFLVQLAKMAEERGDRVNAALFQMALPLGWGERRRAAVAE